MDRIIEKGQVAVLERRPDATGHTHKPYGNGSGADPYGYPHQFQEDQLHQIAYCDHQGGTGGCARLRIDDVSPQELGGEGERIAANYLAGRGWTIAQRNWKCPYGEADIIAYDDEDCVFVEVKTRLVQSERERIYPELAVDESKRKRYVRMAEFYMAQTGVSRVRFDVIAIVVVANRMAKLHHVMDAFGREC